MDYRPDSAFDLGHYNSRLWQQGTGGVALRVTDSHPICHSGGQSWQRPAHQEGRGAATSRKSPPRLLFCGHSWPRFRSACTSIKDCGTAYAGFRTTSALAMTSKGASLKPAACAAFLPGNMSQLPRPQGTCKGDAPLLDRLAERLRPFPVASLSANIDDLLPAVEVCVLRAV